MSYKYTHKGFDVSDGTNRDIFEKYNSSHGGCWLFKNLPYTNIF